MYEFLNGRSGTAPVPGPDPAKCLAFLPPPAILSIRHRACCCRVRDLARRRVVHLEATPSCDLIRNLAVPTMCALALLSSVAKPSYAAGLSAAEQKAVTITNLQEAFNGESNAHARYVAFAAQADKDGYPSVASLFRAAALAEQTRASNHRQSHRRARGRAHGEGRGACREDDGREPHGRGRWRNLRARHDVSDLHQAGS